MDVSGVDNCRQRNNNEKSLEERGIQRKSKGVNAVVGEGTWKTMVGVEAG